MNKRNKKGLLKLESDHVFLKAFKENDPDSPESMSFSDKKQSLIFDKHGLPVLDDLAADPGSEREITDDEQSQDFTSLLEESLAGKTAPSRPKPNSMPIKKRIKRYPPVERQLDLHGCNAAQAQVRTRSFIENSKYKGYFTLRIIVGKGRHSPMGPVLPDVVEDLLVVMKKEGSVLWFEWDRKKKNRSGSLIVYLKQFEQYE